MNGHCLVYIYVVIDDINHIFVGCHGIVLGASEVSANLYCNSRTFVLGRLRDYLLKYINRSVVKVQLLQIDQYLILNFSNLTFFVTQERQEIQTSYAGRR